MSRRRIDWLLLPVASSVAVVLRSARRRVAVRGAVAAERGIGRIVSDWWPVVALLIGCHGFDESHFSFLLKLSGRGAGHQFLGTLRRPAFGGLPVFCLCAL